MGFYAPAQLVRDAREHGVEVRPVCVNKSRWDCSIERNRAGRPVLRLGLRLVKGLAAAEGVKIATRRGEHPYNSIEALKRRADVAKQTLEALAEADAFNDLHIDRRHALWAIKGLHNEELPLFAGLWDGQNQQAPEVIEPVVFLPQMPDGQHVVEDYRSTGLTLRQHPVWFLREELTRQKAVTCADLANIRDGKRVVVAGMMLVRQKPGSAKGVMFITIEDETGVANLIVWPNKFEEQRSLILSAGMLLCHGKVQKEAEILHVIVDSLEDRTQMLRAVGKMDADFNVPIANADEVKAGGPSRRCGPAATTSQGTGAIRVKTRDFR